MCIHLCECCVGRRAGGLCDVLCQQYVCHVETLTLDLPLRYLRQQYSDMSRNCLRMDWIFFTYFFQTLRPCSKLFAAIEIRGYTRYVHRIYGPVHTVFSSPVSSMFTLTSAGCQHCKMSAEHASYLPVMMTEQTSNEKNPLIDRESLTGDQPKDILTRWLKLGDNCLQNCHLGK